MTSREPLSTAIWPGLRYREADAALTMLTEVFGFGLVACFRDPDDDSVVQHAQLHWPEGGGVMLGSYRESPEWPARPGTGALYLVTERVADIAERAKAAGLELLRDLHHDEYDTANPDSLAFSVADAEGNLWSFGTYRGEPVD